MTTRHVAIVGAGVGGLAAAIDLARRGLRVTVLDRGSAPGGKLREIAVGAHAIDAGPTAFTQRGVFDALFAEAGSELDRRVSLRRAETLARHVWAGGAQLDLFADRQRTADAIGTFAGAKDAAGYLAFLKQAERIHRKLEPALLKSSWPAQRDLMRPGGLLGTLRLVPFQSLWAAAGTYMRDPRLQQLVSRYALAAGTSPFVAPAPLMLHAHLEQDGLWMVEGGTQRLATAMADLAVQHGATIRCNAQVKEIVTTDGRAKGVRLQGGELIGADAVLMNGEPNAVATGLLGSKASAAAHQVKFPHRSLSAVTWAVLAETGGLELLRNTMFFSSDYKLEFDIIDTGMLPTHPTVTLVAQDRGAWDGGAGRAAGGPERLLMSVNAPPNGDRRAFSQVEIDQCMQGMSNLMHGCGLNVRFAGPAVMTGPAQFHRLFPASGGALYGQAVLWGRRRPGHRTKIAGLYLAGASTHPGAGMPMAALSGRYAAAEIADELLPPARKGLGRLFRRG